MCCSQMQNAQSMGKRDQRLNIFLESSVCDNASLKVPPTREESSPGACWMSDDALGALVLVIGVHRKKTFLARDVRVQFLLANA